MNSEEFLISFHSKVKKKIVYNDICLRNISFPNRSKYVVTEFQTLYCLHRRRGFVKPERLEIGLQSLVLETCTCFTVFLGKSRCSHDCYYLGSMDTLFRMLYSCYICVVLVLYWCCTAVFCHNFSEIVRITVSYPYCVHVLLPKIL